MLRWIYTKGMAFEIFRIIFAIIKDPKNGKTAITVITIGAIAWYGVDLHNKAMAAINTVQSHVSKVEIESKTTDAIMKGQLDSQGAVLVAKLEAISESVSDIKNSVETTEKRVWQIGRDVYSLKKKNDE